MSKILRNWRHFPIKNLESANQVARHVVSDDKDAIIMPLPDYPGPLLTSILSRNFRSLTICERDQQKRELITSYIQGEFAHKNVQIYPDNIAMLLSQHNNEEAQLRLSQIIDGSNSLADHSKINFKYLVPLSNEVYEAKMLLNFLGQMTLKTGLFSQRCPVDCYMLMSNRKFTSLSAKHGDYPKYRAHTVIFNTFFSLQNLETFDLEGSFKINVRKLQHTAASNNHLYQTVNLVLLKPRSNLLSSLDVETIQEFRCFMSQVLYKRSIQLVNKLEQFVGNCDHILDELAIPRDINTGDLGYESYLRLFLKIREAPHYDRSPLLKVVELSEAHMTPWKS